MPTVIPYGCCAVVGLIFIVVAAVAATVVVVSRAVGRAPKGASPTVSVAGVAPSCDHASIPLVSMVEDATVEVGRTSA